MNQRSDFTADFRLLWISTLAIVIGAICAVIAVVLLWLIAFFTNLFYFQTISVTPRSPGDNTLGWWAALIPVLGGLIIGLMARYGSDRIRGHGIPEALEAILIGRARMKPKVAVLKPLSSAISIGTGGPFGAEGPIIMTGGAVGSIIAQAFHMTASERKTLLVAGAAGGMAATFSTPLAAVLLAVELLLFELKPRSLIPVALASAVAGILRPYLLDSGPLFHVTPHEALPTSALLSSVAVGLLGGLLSMLLTRAVYAAEDLFARVPTHWMWWPAMGGLAVGIGGLIQPHALGVGYDNIERLLTGSYVPRLVVGLLVVKALIWSISLGSGTSGGVLAPLLTMGGGMGALASTFLLGGDKALWPLVGMTAVLGGTMRSPLTGIVFAIELTDDIQALPALLIAAVTAHAFTVLCMKRSILTEKVARRGFHVSREYSVDPLERHSVGDVMSPDVVTIPATAHVKELMEAYFLPGDGRKHQGYPVVDKDGRLVGMVARSNILKQWIANIGKGSGAGELSGAEPIIAYDLIEREAVTAYPWESCRVAAERMAQSHVGRLPVVDPDNPQKVVGIITRSDLLKPRGIHAEEEYKRERFGLVSR
jgi:H+/Cl- antiporter ClcA/predicted transcriptional regulator